MLIPEISGYHAHVYFDADTLDQATTLCHRAKDEMAVAMGRIHRQPVGPHPCWSCQLTFPAEQLGEILPWLSWNRDGLTVFIHPLGEDALADHTRHVIWLGESKKLDISIFL
ncbi:DOPA 4,5-dioxygenase family protein [Amphritea sp. HPY]|uniref:DOPA 4,5-dioxygenase family protein n=1 Tax=Amphritea sp. HPY TaxID=3421652 RepID=UPI003D7EA908